MYMTNILHDIEEGFFSVNRKVRKTVQCTGLEKEFNRRCNLVVRKTSNHLQKKLLTFVICCILPINPYLVQCSWDVLNQNKSVLNILLENIF